MFKRNYLKILKYFLRFLLNFCNLHKIQCFLKKKISFIAEIFVKLLTPRNKVTGIPEHSPLRTPLDSQRVHRRESLLKSAQQHLPPNYPLSQDKLNQKRYLFVRPEILGLFRNTLTAASIYSCHNSQKFPRHVERPLCQKAETYSRIFIAFLQST